MNRASVPPNSVRYRRYQDLKVERLSIQIVRRELELLLASPSSPEVAQQARIKRSQLALLEATFEALQSSDPNSEVHTVQDAEFGNDALREDHERRARWGVVRQALEIVETISWIASALERQATPTSQSPVCALGMVDVSLCMVWLDVRLDDSVEFWEGVRSVEAYKRCLVYSARTAELAAQSYYRALGHIVEDVSVQQLDGGSNDWVSLDIRASNRCIDIKNARQALHGPGHFVEHCVPRFKKDRTASRDVAITGVLSDYLVRPDDYVEFPQTVTVLGEVTIEELRAIYRWSRARFGNKLDLQGLWKPQYVAGWLLEYPHEHYLGRDSAIQALEPQLRRMRAAGFNGNQVPGWMLVLCPAESVIAEFELDEPRRGMVNELRAIQAAVGLSRRSLYVYVLGLTLECLSNKTPPGEVLARMLSLLRIGAPFEGGSTLLGLRDPQSYVEHLIEALTEIGDTVTKRGLEFVGFKLTHPAILLGVEPTGRTITLIAYCGGWQSRPFKARCGKTPLTLARHSTCPVCDHLICDNCGHCAYTCSACLTRQEINGGTSHNSS